MNTCYMINRNKKYFRIRFAPNGQQATYPLEYVQEYKQAHDLTYQEVANQLRELCQHET